MKRIIVLTDAGHRLEAEVTNETFRLLRAMTGRKTKCGDRTEEACVTQEAFAVLTELMAVSGKPVGHVIDDLVSLALR